MFNLGLDVRPDERRDTGLAALTLFGLMTAHALLETARDALFLASVPVQQLPKVYLAIAIIALVIVAFQQERRGGSNPGRAFMATLIAAGVLSIGFWFLTRSARPVVYYALYTWTGVFATLTVIQFWSIVQDQFTITQAKRLFTIIGTGGILGAIVGSGLARILTGVFDPRHLILVAGGVLAVVALGPCITRWDGLPTESSSRPHEDWTTVLAKPVRLVWSRPYLRRLLLLVLVSTIALTLVDYVFKSTVARDVPAAKLGSFFAGTYLALNGLALLAQLFLVGWLTRSMGVSRMLIVLPVLLVLGAVGVAAGGGLLAAVLLKGVDGGLRHSLHRTSIEVLYVPLGSEIRSRIKAFVDVVGQRGGQALASLGILALIAMGIESWLPGVIVILALSWIVLANEIRPHYLGIFRQTLQEGAIRSRIDFPDLDLASLETLIQALNSASDAEVLAALDLLEEQERSHLVPVLLLYHPSTSVVQRALALFSRAGRRDFLPITNRLVGHLDPQVRAALVRARTAIEPDVEMLWQAMNDPSAIVRATALAGLLASEGTRQLALWRAVEEVMEAPSAEGRIALARSIAESPDPVFESILLTLADDEQEAVRLEAARAMRAMPVPRFLPRLLPMLEPRYLREDARTTIEAMGPDVLPALEQALGDLELSRGVRLHLPRTIARFDPQKAADILTARLPAEPDGAIRFKIIRVLSFMKSQHPQIRIDPTVLNWALAETVETAFRLLDWRLQLERGPRERPERRTNVHDLLVTTLQHKERHALDRLFRLLTLADLGEDFRRIWRGLQSSNPKARASSRELLENTLAPPLRDAVLGLVDDVDDPTRLLAAGPYHSPNLTDYEGMLRILLEYPGTTLRSLVAYHVGELKIEALRDALIAMQADPLVRDTATAALDRLDGREVLETDQSDPSVGHGPSDPTEREQVT